MKYSVVPRLAVTLKLTLLWPPPLGPTRIESPGVLKPGAPTLTTGCGGGPDGGGPFGLIPWAWKIELQMLQLFTWLAVRGTSDFLTSDSECPSLLSVLLSVIVPPLAMSTVPGT
jgi:hypothetical protein